MKTYSQNTKIIGLLIIQILFFVSCSEFSPKEPDDKKKKTVLKPTKPDKDKNLSSPDPLDDIRFIRRLSIDMHHKLPEESLFTFVNEESNTFADLVDMMLEDLNFAKAMAQSHLKIWNFEQSSFADLKKIAENDANFNSAFTDTQKENFKEEVILLLRYVIQNNQSTKVLFNSPWSIAHKDLISLLGEDKLDEPWLDEPFGRFKYTDRPANGILSSSGLYSIMNSELKSNAQNTAFHFLTNFMCMDLTSYKAHDFTALSEDDLTQDLFLLGANKKECASCHRHMTAVAPSLFGFQKGNTISEWLDYTDESNAQVSVFDNKSFTNILELSDIISNSQLFHNCFVKNIMKEILQRPLNSYDISDYSSIYRHYVQNNYVLKKALKQFFLSDTYATAPMTNKTSAKIKSIHTGVKTLNNIQLKSIFRQISTITDELEFPPQLSSGGHKISSQVSYRVSGPYYYYLKKLALTASTKIVQNELAQNILAIDRLLLKSLPDNTGITDSSDVIANQIISLWNKFTSYDLPANSSQFTELKNLWDTGYKNGENNEEKTINAWRLVISGIILSPEFFTY